MISGANVSMSGHITIIVARLERRVVCRAWRIDSRSACTCRERPWQAWTWTLRSRSRELKAGIGPAGQRRAGCGTVGANVSLDRAEQRSVALVRQRPDVIGAIGRTGAEHELQLA